MIRPRTPLGGEHASVQRLALLAALMLCLLLLLVPTAGAANVAYCVKSSEGGECPLGVAEQPSIEAATAAASEADNTTIYLTSGTHTAASTFSLGNKPIRLIGTGPTTPVLTAPANAGAAVVSTSSASAKLENLAIAIPASSGMTGLRATNGGQAIEQVRITGPEAALSTGIRLIGPSPSLTDVAITLDGADGGSTGVRIENATLARITDLTASGAAVGISIDSTSNFVVRTARLFTPSGATVSNSDGAIASSLIAPPADAASSATGVGVDVLPASGGARVVNLFNCTLIHAGAAGGRGVRVDQNAAESPLTVNIDSSVVSGFEFPDFSASAVPGAEARINLRYSHFDGSLSTSGTGQILQGTGNRSAVEDFGFVDGAAGNYRLRLDSPLVDRGNPLVGDFTQADSGSDLDRLPRVVNRGAGAMRDVGAYEVQNRAPTAEIRIVTAAPSTTAPVEFSAAGSSDADGDRLSFEWSFDGLPGPSGIAAQKRFPTTGPHIVRLTATDSTGVSTTISRQFDVATGFLPVKLHSRSATLSRRGSFRITIACPDSAISDCTGRLELRTAVKVDAKRYRRHGARASGSSHIKAANQFFRIEPGTTGTINVRTSRLFQNVLAVERQFKLTGGLVGGSTMNARLESNRATYMLKAPRTARRR
jgi:hypothetical protein